MENYKKIFQIHMPSELYERLRDRAFSEQKSVTRLINELLHGVMGADIKK